MQIRIKRQDGPDMPSYWQTFSFTCDKPVSVAHILDRLNFDDDLYDIDGKPAKRIRWECSCMQKMCGACAMRINGTPALACNYFVDDKKVSTLVLEPLSKFPVTADLITDRSIIQQQLSEGKAFYTDKVREKSGEHEQRYTVSKCLKCGLCLEACPNYVGGPVFFGAVYANDIYMIASGSEDKSAVKKPYHEHFENGCSKSLACMEVCPMKIPTLASIAKMNRKK